MRCRRVMTKNLFSVAAVLHFKYLNLIAHFPFLLMSESAVAYLGEACARPPIRLLDPSVHPVAFSVDDLGLIQICDVVERDSIINKRLFL